MASENVSVTGTKQLAARLRAIDAPEANLALMTKLGNATVADAKRIVHRRTGNLGRSIHVAQVSPKGVLVAASESYAAPVEFGTRGGQLIVPRNRKALRWAATAAGARLSGTPRKGAAVIFAMRVIRGATRAYPFLMPGARKALARANLAEHIIVEWNKAAEMAEYVNQWQANHAYSVYAVVIPTTFAGYTWRCTTAGTSGGSEPSWPADPSVSPTVNDNGTVWTVGTGFRQATTAGVISLVTTFAQANPTIVRQVLPVRPRSFTTAALPVFYIGDLSESLLHTQGTRTRTFEGFSAFLVDMLGDETWAADRMDFAADVLVDLFTGGLHAISGRSLLEQVATIDTEFEEGGVRYPALEFQFGRTQVTEGRD